MIVAGLFHDYDSSALIIPWNGLAAREEMILHGWQGRGTRFIYLDPSFSNSPRAPQLKIPGFDRFAMGEIPSIVCRKNAFIFSAY